MTNEELKNAVGELFSRGRQATADWESSAFDVAVARTGPRVVLFGAGGVGRKTLAGLRSLGIEPLAFADNNPALWGTRVNGVLVQSVTEAAKEYGETALFIVSIWRGEDCRMADQRRQLADLKVKSVIPFGPVFWKAGAKLLPHYALDFPSKVFDHQAAILDACQFWADDQSRAEFLSQVRWRLTHDFDCLADPVGGDIYFPEDIVRLSDREEFVDCGAFDGDTLRTFIRRTGGRFSKAVAIEPDALNFRKLEQTVSQFPPEIRSKVSMYPYAVGERNEKVTFAATGTPASVMARPIEESPEVTIDCVRLDDLLQRDQPTFVKMDIEGAEPDAIRGMSAAIRRSSPTLAVCVYHSQEHLWSIPHLLRELQPDYRLYLRPHLFAVWDLVCYAVPPSRQVSA